MKKYFFISFLLFLTVSQAQTFEVSGMIFLDQNGNGIKEPSEESLKNVLVSNGKMLTSTNGKGKFIIDAETNDAIFPVLPKGYSFNKKSSWWFPVQPLTRTTTSQKIKGVDFGLLPSPSKVNFKALIIGDIQVGDQQELWYADQSILSELRQREDYDFSIFLGDLVNDKPELFKPLKEMINNFKNPFWMVYGNHDKNSQRNHKTQHLDFSEAFGPTRYAFFKEDVLFIILNSIEPVGDYGYNGNYSASDLDFLSALLKQVKGDQLLVISQHIPLGMMDNKQKFLELLENRKNILLLSGHTHTVFQNFRKRNNQPAIHELTAGAVSGYWWTGEKDWQGIPLALMQDGTPRGYFEIHFSKTPEGTDYQLHYKGVGLSTERQLSLWFGATNTEISNTLSGDERTIFANVFAGSTETEVQMRIDGREWQPMGRRRILDPFVNRIKKLQSKKLYPNGISRRSPYLSRESAHIWKGLLPAKLEEGLHKLEVLAKDEYGLDHRESAWFWVKE